MRAITKLVIRLLQTLILAIEWHNCEFCTLHIGLYFQGQTFSCYAFSVEIIVQAADIPAYLPRLAWPRHGVLIVSDLLNNAQFTLTMVT